MAGIFRDKSTANDSKVQVHDTHDVSQSTAVLYAESYSKGLARRVVSADLRRTGVRF